MFDFVFYLAGLQFVGFGCFRGNWCFRVVICVGLVLLGENTWCLGLV